MDDFSNKEKQEASEILAKLYKRAEENRIQSMRCGSNAREIGWSEVKGSIFQVIHAFDLDANKLGK